MEKSYALRKSNKNFVIATSFFLMLSIPLIVYELLNQKTTFDTREDAFEEIEVSEENPCVISLPNVNPYTLEVGKSIRVLVDAEVEDGGGITSLSIADTTGESIFSQTYGDSPNVISSSFIYTPSKTGIISLLGAIKKADGTSLGCKISSPYDVQGLQAISNNSAPEFTTDPNDSTPSRNLSTGTEYSYTVKAKDIDKDRINYFVYFTPGENWLKQTVIKDGSDGNLEIIFKGQPDKAASYLVSVLAHDGYSNHLSTQTWVLNVSPNANDTPDVKITAPAEGTRLTVGDMLSVSWTASDLNMIVKYELYITKYPFDESKWIPINTDIQFSRATYEYNTSKLEPGTYNLIVRAIDNQDPAGVGMALSQEVIIADKDGNVPETPVLTPEKEGNKNQEKGKEDDKEKEKIDTDDSIYLKIPQVINMTPSETDSFADKKVMIKGTIIPSINASIDDDTIMFKLDDEDITKKISINKIGNGEYTL
ncbi:hypothetical protein J6Z48_02140, partial [bacterium]|nr:hypothetical protein [bacterium]